MLAICQENLCISFLYQIMANVKIISTTEWLKYNKTMSSKLSTSCPQNPFEILFCKRSFRPAPKLTRSSLRDLSMSPVPKTGSLTRPARGLRMLQKRIPKRFCSVVTLEPEVFSRVPTTVGHRRKHLGCILRPDL